VVATSDLFPDWLALRALDLEPHLGLLPQDLPKGVLRQGLAYAQGRGTFQAGWPLLRIPLLCAVRPGVQAVHGTRPWTAAQFEAVLTDMAPDYVQPSAPLPWVPYGLGLPEMAAVGSGAVLAKGDDTSCRATFGGGPAARAMVEIANWARHGSDAQVWYESPPQAQASTRTFGVVMFDGATILGRGPIAGGLFAPPLPAPADWAVVPIPAFPARYAVPVRTVQVLVCRDTPAPAQAAAFAAGLLSAEAQADLLTFTGALALRPAQALRQLAFAAPRVQGADIIVSAESDVTESDAWGPRTDGNAAARALAQQDLGNALQGVTGNAGYMFNFVRSFDGPFQNFDYLLRTNEPALPAESLVPGVLRAAEAAANAGQVYAPYAWRLNGTA